MTQKIDFIGIGAQKSGTTWLADCLREHPQIAYARKKEFFFFNTQFCYLFNDENLSNFHKGVNCYLNQFPEPLPGQIRGEVATNYYNDPQAAENIKKYFPNVKLLAILRNPVDMIYSLYWFGCSAVRTAMPKNFEKMVKQGDYLDRGMYYKHLKRFYDLFPQDNIHVMLLDDVKNNPDKVLKKLFAFLNVDDKFKPSMLTKKSNPALRTKRPLLKKTSYFLLNALSNVGLQKISRWFITNDFLYNIYKKINLTTGKNPPMNPETRKKLIKYYQDDINKLENLINRDLSEWKQ
jgi:hypothetical protein